MQSPLPGDTQTAFPPLLRGVILGLIIGVAIGYVLPKGSSQPKTSIAPQNQVAATQPQTQNTQTAPTPPPPAAPQGFYGKVTKNEGGTLTLQEVLPSKQPSTKVFSVKASEQTTFTYQKLTKDPKAPFTASSGKLQDIKKDMYLFVLTQDNPATSTNVTATSIMYSEKSPF